MHADPELGRICAGRALPGLHFDLEHRDDSTADDRGVLRVGHPKWVERPVAVVELADGAALDHTRMCQGLTMFEDWQLPDDLIIVETPPETTTGKIGKNALRSA